MSVIKINTILTIIPIVASCIPPRCVLFCAPGAHFLAPTGSFDLTLKKNAWLRATFSQLVARTRPPGLDLGSPRRSGVGFCWPKPLDFRSVWNLVSMVCSIMPSIDFAIDFIWIFRCFLDRLGDRFLIGPSICFSFARRRTTLKKACKTSPMRRKIDVWR